MPAKQPSPDTDNVSTQPQRKIASTCEYVLKLRGVPAYSRVWAVKSNSCLSLGLDPSKANHRPVICNNCTHFWEKKLKYDLSNCSNVTGTWHMLSEQPFDCPGNAERCKLHARDQLEQCLPGKTVGQRRKLLRRPGLVCHPRLTPPDHQHSVGLDHQDNVCYDKIYGFYYSQVYQTGYTSY